jgi:hypothetical protein
MNFPSLSNLTLRKLNFIIPMVDPPPNVINQSAPMLLWAVSCKQLGISFVVTLQWNRE